MAADAAPVRYAVVGAGWISQAAFMPGVRQTGNSALTALVTGDHRKAEALGPRYGIERIYHYDAYLAALDSRGFDAIYLALPNWQHRDFAIPALERGIHVLLEKPMATSEDDCRAIIAAARRGGAKLMIAYRLHFEPATLEALRVAQAGALGALRLFSSSFSQPLDVHNHRAQNGFWAGPVADLGPYPINAVRNLFRAEPVEVMAWGTAALGLGFDDAVCVHLRFEDDRMAQFSVAYGLETTNEYRITGEAGSLLARPAYALASAIGFEMTQDGRFTPTPFQPVDQFSGETAYFSDCILNGLDPEPDGEEGLLDVRVIAAIERALQSGRPEALAPVTRVKRPLPDQRHDFPPSRTPDLVHAAPPSA